VNCIGARCDYLPRKCLDSSSATSPSQRIAMAGLILGYIGVGLLVILLVVCLVLWRAANTAVLPPIHADFVS
jgi:hypothetical protein